MQTFLRVHSSKIKGSLSGFDRVRFRGTLRLLANSNGMNRFLAFFGILLKEFKEWSLDITDRIRRASIELATARQRPVIYLHSCNTDKEAMASDIAARERITEGLICVLTCVESCQTFSLRRDAEKKRLELVPFTGRCLHHYFYLIHPLFGFMQIRLQTWAPYTIYININGREWLANQLRLEGISYEKRDNCFVDVEDLTRAQELLDEQLRTSWDTILQSLVREFHPVHGTLPIFQREIYYWSAEETEWATDVLFRSPSDLAQVYPGLVRHSVTHIGCENVLRYLGRRPSVHSFRNGEITTSILGRHCGIRCKHTINGNSIKMYDKQESVLRIETTMNRIENMKVFRPKASDPEGKPCWQRLRKGVADLHRRTKISHAANERYLEDLASVEHAESLGQSWTNACRPTTLNGRRVRALNPFHG